MKKILRLLALICFLCLLIAAASASTKDEVRTAMENALTEVYGYTVEELEDFTIEVAENAQSVDYFTHTRTGSTREKRTATRPISTGTALPSPSRARIARTTPDRTPSCAPTACCGIGNGWLG